MAASDRTAGRARRQPSISKETLHLMAAPTSAQPGGYVRRAYAGRTDAATPEAELIVERDGPTWRIGLRWPCPDPIRDVRDDPGRFPDAAAVLAPRAEGANWATMGAPGMGVEGVLWRADRRDLYAIAAEGLGTVVRTDPPPGWSAQATWRDGRWHVELVQPQWPTLDSQRRLAVAVWRGAARERGGLKSISQGWLAVDAT